MHLFALFQISIFYQYNTVVKSLLQKRVCLESYILTLLMQEQINISNSIITDDQISTLQELIRSTYLSKSSNQINSVSNQIFNLLSMNYSYFQTVIRFIVPDFTIQSDFKVSCCSVIKNFFYYLANKDDDNNDKSMYLKDVFELLISVGMPKKMREILGMGVQHILNKESTQEKDPFIQALMNKFQQMLHSPENWSRESVDVLFGLSTLYLAYANSIVQPEDLLNFFQQSFHILIHSASLLLNFITNYITQNNIQQDNLFQTSAKIFQIIEIVFQRLFDDEEEFTEEIAIFRNSEILFNSLIVHLNAFGENRSIITKFPTLNSTKQSILEIIYTMNMNVVGAFPRPISEMLFMTFMVESLAKREKKRIENADDHVQQILCRCMEIIESQMLARVNLKLYTDYKIDIIFALFMYSKTSEQELSYFHEIPEKFVEIAEDYTQGYSKSPIIKIRAANLIKSFIEVFDEGVKNILQLLVIFITSSIGTNQDESEVLQAAKQQFEKYEFWGLTSFQKLDIAFMILALLSPKIIQRSQLYNVVMALLLSQANLFCSIKNDIVKIRLMRLLGYYPTSIYFAFIKVSMELGRAFVLEGMNSFERISKNRAFIQIFPHIGIVFEEILDYIDVSDSIFEQIVMNNYENALKKNENLYFKIIMKLRQTFNSNISQNFSNSKQKVILSINYLYKLIKRQKADHILQVLEKQFLNIEGPCKSIPLLEDSLIEMYQLLLEKYIFVNYKILEFAVEFSCAQRLSKFTSMSPYFRFINKTLRKTDDQNFINAIYSNYMNFAFQFPQINPDISKELCYTLSYIYISNKHLIFQERQLQQLCIFIIKHSQNAHWYKFLLCHIIYKNSEHVRETLIGLDIYYTVMIEIFRTYNKSKLQRKVAILAMQELIFYQPQKKLSQEIVKYCVRILGEQEKAYRSTKISKAVLKQKIPAEMRRIMESDRNADREQRRENESMEQGKNNLNLNKHPFDDIDEFEMFKIKILSSPNWSEMVSEDDRQELSKVCQMAWHKNKVRKIVKVNRNL